jgi:type II secretory ATPase GspE/PulE/Tfp pilus assembly ATPase PilB-like protein
LPDDKLDIRVSTLPTSFGESVVMRLLRSSAVGLDFKKLGVRGKSFMDLKREVERPNGMILTTGPTGSGKTTTLYATLNKLNNDETKIITLEDPIEYKLPGINQSQVDKSKDYDFAKGLRSILRQDPDVVMVGEIRDLETADVAINAALTGHLVLSTLHTNDAAGAIPRFLSMGVKPFLLSPSLNAVIGQRLVRKICEKCKEELELDNEVITRVMNIINSIPENSGFVVDKENQMKFYKGKGCDACNKEGYKGRTGIYEVFTLTPEIEKMILSGKVSEYDVKQVTQKEGMVSMVQDGILKAMDGITTVEEIFRVTEE